MARLWAIALVENDDLTPIPNRLRNQQSRRPAAVRRLDRMETTALLAAVVLVVLRHGLVGVTTTQAWEFGIGVVVALTALVVSGAYRWAWSVDRFQHLRSHAVEIALLGTWIVGCPMVPFVVDFPESLTSLADLFRWSEIVTGLLAVLYGVDATRRVASGGRNPAFLLAASFVLLIGVGTLLLMLPRARVIEGSAAEHDGAPFRVAFFTATSASCVTGLVVVPTGSYWSDFGHVVILAMFQIGGLGIMTCGAFFAVALGSRMAFRETATLGNLLDTESMKSVRALLRTIFVATFATELLGGLLLSTMRPDLPAGDRLFWGFFHSASAFCNAGFSLRDEGFLGWGERWQIGLVATVLVIAGGLGFAVTYNVWLWLRTKLGSTVRYTPLFHLPRERVRLTLGTRIVLVTTAVLLVGGMLGYYVLEAMAPSDAPFLERVCDAWFQSVTFRTAGFNTVDLGQLQQTTKLFAILLMFIGASPGSTGGGIKTMTIAITVLAVAATLRGHDRVDVWNRTIPAKLVNRALTIIALGLVCLTTITILLAMFESGSPHRFLDLFFESTSAFATVGVSTGLTADLRPPSQYVLTAAMFLGRIGPLTLLIALAGNPGDVRYNYPEETVSLG